ncbi:unnamed protein product [Orchesella dallaii]|uniref:Odorant receptor n=1 Tax=Orchesella dallaii TaxID=48710 RepID=A0ABP1RBR9_9HEXA
MLLSSLAKSGFHRFLSIVCLLKVLPYEWDPKGPKLKPVKPFGLFIFHLHTCLTFIVCPITIYRVTCAYMGDASVLMKVYGVFASACHAMTALGFGQLALRKSKIMGFCNRVLFNLEKDAPTSKNGQLENVSNYQKHTKSMTRHMLIGLVMLTVNIPVHLLLTIPSSDNLFLICTPLFLGSLFMECRDHSLLVLFPFILWEFYTLTKFLLMNCFYCSFLMVGLGLIDFQLQSLQNDNFKINTTAQTTRLVKYRGIQILTQILNDSFWIYLSFFTHILFFILSILLFGTIRLIRIDPRQSLMFPMCGFRCGYEVFSPILYAGQVDASSGNLLSEFEETVTGMALRKRGGGGWKEHKVLDRMRKSCVNIRCTAGNFFMFENFVAISSLHGVVETTFDLLVTFKEDQIEQ